MDADLWRPFSIRFLVPAIDNAWGIDGRPCCYLRTAYGTVVWMGDDGVTVLPAGQGRPVMVNFYESPWPAAPWYDISPIETVLDMDDVDWRDCRRPHWSTGGNPCTTHGIGHPRQPLAGWCYPRILLDPAAGKILAAKKGSDQLLLDFA